MNSGMAEKTKKVHLGVKVEKVLKAKLQAAAVADGRSVSSLVNIFLTRGVIHHEEQKKAA